MNTALKKIKSKIYERYCGIRLNKIEKQYANSFDISYSEYLKYRKQDIRQGQAYSHGRTLLKTPLDKNFLSKFYEVINRFIRAKINLVKYRIYNRGLKEYIKNYEMIEKNRDRKDYSRE